MFIACFRYYQKIKMTKSTFENSDQVLSDRFCEIELGSVAEITTGCQYPVYDLPRENLHPFTGIDKIIDNQIILSESKYIRMSERERIKYKFKNGDIIFVHRTSPQQLGKSIRFDLKQTVLHTKYLRIRPKEGCDSHFLSLMLNVLRQSGTLHQIASVRENLSCIVIGDLKKIKIPFPSIDAQRDIVIKAEKDCLITTCELMSS